MYVCLLACLYVFLSLSIYLCLSVSLSFCVGDSQSLISLSMTLSRSLTLSLFHSVYPSVATLVGGGSGDNFPNCLTPVLPSVSSALWCGKKIHCIRRVGPKHLRCSLRDKQTNR